MPAGPDVIIALKVLATPVTLLLLAAIAAV